MYLFACQIVRAGINCTRQNRTVDCQTVGENIFWGRLFTAPRLQRGAGGDKCLLLGEKVGELFKAVRKAEGLLIDTNFNFTEIGDELSDIFIYLCAIANRKGIDLENAFRKKEEKNKKRTWQKI
ncbi:MAG: hypothetical protein J7L95_06780 [Prolixibacteraceae bacterium]|nr:hypothetical protein [Prolixibacteraceae bacterium]